MTKRLILLIFSFISTFTLGQQPSCPTTFSTLRSFRSNKDTIIPFECYSPNNNTAVNLYNDSKGIFNVKAFGAKCDGATDDYIALQSTIDAAENWYSNSFVNGGTIYVPTSQGQNCKSSKPLRIRKSGTKFIGDSAYTSGISQLNANQGVLMYVAPSVGFTSGLFPPPILSSPLVGNTGSSVYSAGLQDGSGFNLRECGCMESIGSGLNGFTVEFWFKPDGHLTNGVIIQSGGSISGNGSTAFSANNSAFYFIYKTDQSVDIHIGLSGGIGTLNTGANSVLAGTPHHIAATYDGNSLRLFVDGVLKASVGQSGNTITQNWFEDVNWMFGTGCTAMACSNNPPAKGWYDGLRISNIARYTSNFTVPTNKFTLDGNTIYLLNNDNIIDGILFGGNSNINPTVTNYVAYHQTTFGANNNAVLNGLVFQNITFDGLFDITSTILSKWTDVIHYGNEYAVWWCDNNCYLDTFDSVKWYPSHNALIGQILGPSSTLDNFNNPQWTSSKVSLLCNTCNVVIHDLWLEQNSLNYAGAIFVGSSFIIDGGGVSLEAGVTSNYQGVIVAEQGNKYGLVQGVNIEADYQPPFILGNGFYSFINNTIGEAGGHQPSYKLFRVSTTGSRPDVPVTNINNKFTGFNSVPLSDNTAYIAYDHQVTTGTNTSCVTSAGAASTCTTTVTWNTPLLDTTYKVACALSGSITGTPYILNTSNKSATNIVVTIANLTAVASSATQVDCTATRDSYSQ